MENLKDLIEKIFDKKDENFTNLKIIDEKSNKISVYWLSHKSLEDILSCKYERINFEIVGGYGLRIN